MSANNVTFVQAPDVVLGDGASNTTTGNAPASAFNGTTWDRQRNNTELTLLASAARTVTTDSADQTNFNGRGIHVVVDITAGAVLSLVVTIQGKDPVSGKYYTLLASAALTGVSTTVLRVYPALLAVANTIANDIVPRTWRVDVAAGNATSATYSVGAIVVR